MEIVQLLEQSGWSRPDIEKALKRAEMRNRVDRIISTPFRFCFEFIKSIPLKIQIMTKLFLKLIFALLNAVSVVAKIIFIAPPRMIANFFSNKNRERQLRKNSIKELSRYIEKGIRKGTLESDIFIELLESQWNKEIIDKAFSKAHYKILKGDIVSFFEYLIFLPFIFAKKSIDFAFSLIKNIFVDFPLAVFGGLKGSLLSLASQSINVKNKFIGFLSETYSRLFKRPKISLPKAVKIPAKPKHSPLNLRMKLWLSGFANFWNNAFQKTASSIKGLYLSITGAILKFIRKIFNFFIFSFRKIKYFVFNFPAALNRLRQRIIYSFMRFIKLIPKKSVAFFVATFKFFAYDLWVSLKYILMGKSIIIAKNIYKYLVNVEWFDLPAKIQEALFLSAKSFFGLLGKILFYPVYLLLKIDREKFNMPFEVAEHIILKIYEQLKKIFSPVGIVIALLFRSIKRTIVPVSKEVSEYIPQNLSEVPIGKVPDTMRVSDILKLSTRMFKTRRMRTLLTILGIGIGIGAILFLVSLGYGLQRILLEEIATSDALLSLDISTRDEELLPLTKEAIDKFVALSGVSYVSPLVSVAGQVTLENVTANTMINGVLPNYFKLSGIRPIVGGLFKEGEEDSVLISLPIVKLLNLQQTGGEISSEQINQMVGKTASITLLLIQKTETGEEVKTVEFETKFKIAGVIEDATESLIYFPLSRLEDVGINKYQSAKVRVAESGLIEPVRAQAVAMGFIVAALSDTIEQANKVFSVLQVVLAMFGIVALTVSAIGMFNTMTIALLERTQEIGIMKSLGASNRNIWELFLAESIMMGFLGGVGGILVGYLGSEGLNLSVRFLAGALGGKTVNLFERPWWFILTILVFSTVVGLFTGLWPARHAARIRILAALRYK